MNENRFQKGIDSIKKIGLSSAEKKFILGDLMLRTQSENSIDTKMGIKSPWSFNLFESVSFHSTAFTYSFLAFVVLMGGGSLVMASDTSIPGEFLYPIKIHISEPLQGAATFNTVSKVEWEGQKVERRFEEIEILAVQGKLNDSNRDEVQNRLQEQTKTFYDTIEKESSVAVSMDDAKSDLEEKIDVHGRILEKLENHSETKQKDEISKFRINLGNIVAVNKVTTMTKATSFMAMSAPVASDQVALESASAVSTTTLEKDEKEIETLIKDTEDKINSKNEDKNTSDLEKDILGDTLKDLKVAKDSLKTAQAKKKLGNLQEASVDLKNSRKTAKNAKTFYNQGLKISRERPNI